MQYYYLVNSFKTVLDNGHYLNRWEAVGVTEQNIDHRDTRTHAEEILMWAEFANHSSMDRWEAIPGVTPLGDPLDGEELADEHMTKLARFHPFEQRGADWVHSQTGTKLSKKPHLRKLMTEHVGKMHGSFRFRLFV